MKGKNTDYMFTILHMTENDLAEVAALERLSFTSDAWTEEDFRMTMKSPIDTIWVYRDAARCKHRGGASAFLANSDLLGYCVLRIIGDEAEVLNICVAPDGRGKGAGDLLMDVMVQKCRDNGVAAIWLEVRSQNTAARGLYEKHGFLERGVRKAYYQEPTDDALLLCKSDYAYEERGCGCADQA